VMSTSETGDEQTSLAPRASFLSATSVKDEDVFQFPFIRVFEGFDGSARCGQGLDLLTRYEQYWSKRVEWKLHVPPFLYGREESSPLDRLIEQGFFTTHLWEFVPCTTIK
jgi:hypothetical protein